MENLANALESAVDNSTFHDLRLGRINANQLPELFETWRGAGSCKYNPWLLEVHTCDQALRELIDSLRSVVSPFVRPELDQIGLGLFFLSGGTTSMAFPTVPAFAKLLVKGAGHLGSGHVAELIAGWASGAPMSYKTNYLLDGVRIDQPIEMESGVHLLRLPRSAEQLPFRTWLAYSAQSEGVRKAFFGATVLSVDCYMFPVLFKPENGDLSTIESHNWDAFTYSSAATIVPGFSIQKFCKALSQVAGCPVSNSQEWQDLGELNAFPAGSLGGGKSKETTAIQTGNLFTKSEIKAAVRILISNSGNKTRKFDLAVNRWIRAIKTTSIVDALIELRIAFEALYEIGNGGEKTFRVATYAAWHLGKDASERQKCFDVVRALYSDASNVVHGSGPKKTLDKPELLDQALNYCYRGIMKRRAESGRNGKTKWDALPLIFGANP